MMAAGARLPPLQLSARDAASPPQQCESRRSATFRALSRDLDRAVATATSESPLRHPPWSTDERAMTLFRDWDVDEAAKQVRPPRRLHAIAASSAKARDDDDLPPIETTRTATGMIILHEARPEVLAQRRELARRVAAAEAAASALAAATAKREREAAEAAKRERVYTVSREELIQKHDPGGHGNGAAGGSPATSPRAGTGGTGAGGTGGAAQRSVLRFKYKFVPPPWEPPRFPGQKKPKPKKDARIAAAAGVRETSKIRMPVAPSHLRYIENLEDTVAELATEVAARRRFLMQRIDRFLAPGWRPFEGGAGSGSGAASAALGGLSSGGGGGGGGKRSLADAIGAALHADDGDDGGDDDDDDDDGAGGGGVAGDDGGSADGGSDAV